MCPEGLCCLGLCCPRQCPPRPRPHSLWVSVTCPCSEQGWEEGGLRTTVGRPFQEALVATAAGVEGLAVPHPWRSSLPAVGRVLASLSDWAAAPPASSWCSENSM